MKTVQEFLRKLSSRKFLLALAAFLQAVNAGEPLLAGAIAAIYVLAEAAVDRAAVKPED